MSELNGQAVDLGVAEKPQVDIDLQVRRYIACRDEIDARNKAHEKAMEGYLSLQKQLSGILQAFLDDNGIDSIKTKHGTAYATTRYSATLADPDMFMKHVLETKAFELLDKRANVTAVKEYVKEHNTTPPGCNLSSITSVGVRRPAKAKDVTAAVTPTNGEDHE